MIPLRCHFHRYGLFYYATDLGANILRAQYIYCLLYVINLAIVHGLYIKSKVRASERAGGRALPPLPLRPYTRMSTGERTHSLAHTAHHFPIHCTGTDSTVRPDWNVGHFIPHPFHLCAAPVQRPRGNDVHVCIDSLLFGQEMVLGINVVYARGVD